MSAPGNRLRTDKVVPSVNYLLRRASQRFKEAVVPLLKQSELSTLELTTMSLIQANDGCILRTLADAVGVEPPAMNRIVNSLEDKYLASRHKSSEDSRYTFFRLTDTGVELLKETSDAVEQAESDLLGTLQESEQREFLQILKKFS